MVKSCLDVLLSEDKEISPRGCLPNALQEGNMVNLGFPSASNRRAGACLWGPVWLEEYTMLWKPGAGQVRVCPQVSSWAAHSDRCCYGRNPTAATRSLQAHAAFLPQSHRGHKETTVDNSIFSTS